jgi:hypothetical protein
VATGAQDAPTSADNDRMEGMPDRSQATEERLTMLGGFNVKVPGTNARRTVPAPWIDCDQCGWRHYPSITGGRWHIATTCVSCSAALRGA